MLKNFFEITIKRKLNLYFEVSFVSFGYRDIGGTEILE